MFGKGTFRKRIVRHYTLHSLNNVNIMVKGSPFRHGTGYLSPAMSLGPWHLAPCDSRIPNPSAIALAVAFSYGCPVGIPIPAVTTTYFIPLLAAFSISSHDN